MDPELVEALTVPRITQTAPELGSRDGWDFSDGERPTPVAGDEEVEAPTELTEEEEARILRQTGMDRGVRGGGRVPPVVTGQQRAVADYVNRQMTIDNPQVKFDALTLTLASTIITVYGRTFNTDITQMTAQKDLLAALIAGFLIENGA
jgi:hypothetical protein